ncbi:hypothetical protein [Aminivibrio sp.]|uniref:hypothetical protein n=1 Tax=Aminivibrio sp. TaxID=1872489 RepID=UPI00345E19F1
MSSLDVYDVPFLCFFCYVIEGPDARSPPPFRSWQARKGLHEAYSKVREEGDELHRKIGCVLHELPLADLVRPRARTLRVLMIGLPP